MVTTHWSVVLRAGDVTSSERDDALERLCRAYWFPLYAYVRRRGHPEEEARDLTQGFFARLLEKNYLREADATRGRFRTFLLTALGNFLANEWDRSRTRKRGGGVPFLSLDELDAEGRYLHEPADHLSPEKIFERRWAEALLESVFAQLRREFDDQGRGLRFDDLKAFLLGVPDAPAYGVMAERMGISETGARSVVHRMRKRFREITRAEIAQTVEHPAEIDAELRHLLAALAE